MDVGKLIGIIGDEDTVTGFLLAGVGHRTAEGSNFLIVKQDTQLQQVEEAFMKLSQRNDVGIILINQHIANDIRHVLKDYTQTIPTVLEIPSKEHPYDPEQDYIMVRSTLYGNQLQLELCCHLLVWNASLTFFFNIFTLSFVTV
jgi:V-type H+-transporting ATPase subunit F